MTRFRTIGPKRPGALTRFEQGMSAAKRSERRMLLGFFSLALSAPATIVPVTTYNNPLLALVLVGGLFGAALGWEVRLSRRYEIVGDMLAGELDRMHVAIDAHSPAQLRTQAVQAHTDAYAAMRALHAAGRAEAALRSAHPLAFERRGRYQATLDDEANEMRHPELWVALASQREEIRQRREDAHAAVREAIITVRHLANAGAKWASLTPPNEPGRLHAARRAGDALADAELRDLRRRAAAAEDQVITEWLAEQQPNRLA